MTFSLVGRCERTGAVGAEGSDAHSVAGGLAGSTDLGKAPVPELAPAPAPAGWAKGAVPWLAGLTLAVLYLLYRTFV